MWYHSEILKILRCFHYWKMHNRFSNRHVLPLHRRRSTLRFVLSDRFCAGFFFFFLQKQENKTFIFNTASVICCCRKKWINSKALKRKENICVVIRSQNIFFITASVRSFILTSGMRWGRLCPDQHHLHLQEGDDDHSFVVYQSQCNKSGLVDSIAEKSDFSY